jgi:transposase
MAKLRQEYPGAQIRTCYEAGPCGFWLHRKLAAKGVHNVVVAPVALNGMRKTDKRDARRLCELLVRHERGDRHALSAAAVPSVDQELERGLMRHRQALKEELLRCAQRGRSLALLQGQKLGRKWWGVRNWPGVKTEVAAGLVPILEDYQGQAMLLSHQLQAVDQQLAELAKRQPVAPPRGVGALTWLTLLLEVVDWSRFKNRRQVASYTGLCPGEHTSGGQRRDLPIDKHGNPRARRALVVAAWRMLQWQPDYPPLAKLRATDGKRSRKRAIVAVARRLAIDLWRLATGQSTPEKLGLAAVANPLHRAAA